MPLRPMPPIVIDQKILAGFGKAWEQDGPPKKGQYSPTSLCRVFDDAIGKALAEMLTVAVGPRPNQNSLQPSAPNVVEVGPVRVVGGVRTQNFDVGYRPDGVRFVLDTKTLNNKKSVQKNYQNQINDLATEATTVHTRFPYALVAFVIAMPASALPAPQRNSLTRTLERLTGRTSPLDSPHKAEVISLVVWEATSGAISDQYPEKGSVLRIERFSEQVSRVYGDRYKGLPPHDDDDPPADAAEDDD